MLWRAALYVPLAHRWPTAGPHSPDHMLPPFSTRVPLARVPLTLRWIELVHGARQAGLSIRAKANQLWQVGAGLPLDAIKKGTIVEWACPYHLDESEKVRTLRRGDRAHLSHLHTGLMTLAALVLLPCQSQPHASDFCRRRRAQTPLLDALGKNSSLRHLDLSLSGIDWIDANASGRPLVEHLNKSSAALSALRTLILSSANTTFRIPVAKLRKSSEALQALRATSFFTSGGPMRKEMLFMGDLLRKEGEKAPSAKELIYASEAAVRLVSSAVKGKSNVVTWELEVSRLMSDGVIRRGHLEALICAETLRHVGFTCDELLHTCGFDLPTLRVGGFSAGDMRAIGLKAAELGAAGYTCRQLNAGGYTANDLKRAGFVPSEMKDGGYAAAQLRDVGFSAAELQLHTFSAFEMRLGGYPVTELHPLGYSPLELREAGYLAKDCRQVHTLEQLRQGGFPALGLRDAGFACHEMKRVGFTAAPLKAGGYTGNELRAAGFSCTELRDAAFSAKKVRAHRCLARSALPPCRLAALPPCRLAALCALPSLP